LILGFCVPLLALVIVQAKAGDILGDYSWSVINTVHDDRMMNKYHFWLCDLVDCSENKWFMGENLQEDEDECIKKFGVCINNVIYTPNLENIISGADGGVSLRTWWGPTIVYLGDNHGNASSTDCDHIKECNDAITVLTDTDGPKNGLDARILMSDQDPSRFKPLNIPGVLSSHPFGPALDKDDFGPFSYATGIERGYYIIGDSSQYTAYPEHYMWYATAVNTNHAQSFLTCSVDGIEFGPCPPLDWPDVDLLPVQLFSTNKFIIVSPVGFNRHWWSEIDENHNCTLCKLKPHLTDYGFGYSQGMLLFASGGGARNQRADDGGYRESPLYMAYIELQSYKVWYFTGDGWSAKEKDAVPVLSYLGKSPKDRKKYLFGEISVKLFPTSNLEEAYLILLANHEMRLDIGGRVYYRTAPLLNPDQWSDPQLTCGIGYGPYILDGYVEVEPGTPDRLWLYHTLVAWNGKHPPQTIEPYGVFTTRLRLREDPTDVTSPCGEPPIWPPQP